MTLDTEAIKKRLADATDGPWFISFKTRICNDRTPVKRIASCDSWENDLFPSSTSNEKANATFIAHAPTDIDALVKEVERLREAQNTILDRLDKAMKAYHDSQRWYDPDDDPWGENEGLGYYEWIQKAALNPKPPEEG